MQDTHEWRNIVAMAEKSMARQIQADASFTLDLDTMHVVVKSRMSQDWRKTQYNDGHLYKGDV